MGRGRSPLYRMRAGRALHSLDQLVREPEAAGNGTVRAEVGGIGVDAVDEHGDPVGEQPRG